MPGQPSVPTAAAMGSALDRLADAEGWGSGRTTLRQLMNRLFERSGPNDPVVARTGDHDEPPTTPEIGRAHV